MRSVLMRSALGVACAVALFISSTAHAAPAIVGSEKVLAFREAAAGARDLLGGPSVYDLDAETPERILSRLATARPEVIVAVGPTALRVAAQVPETPIVYLLVPDPEAIVGPLRGRPFIGVGLYVAPELILAQLDRLCPGKHDLWTVYSSAESSEQLESLRAAATGRGYTLSASQVRDASSAARALLDPPGHIDAFLMLADRVVRNAAADEALLRLAFLRGFPVVGVSAADVRAGALFALQLAPRALGLQAAELALRARASSKPETIRPTGYRLVINLATANRLGYTLPAEIVAGAEVVGR